MESRGSSRRNKIRMVSEAVIAKISERVEAMNPTLVVVGAAKTSQPRCLGKRHTTPL